MYSYFRKQLRDYTRHKCFISYYSADKDEVEAFIREFDEQHDIFISRHVGVMDEDIINSNDSAYIMRAIRERYLAESTVTIVLIGKCTWARKYIDWEIASTLRNDPRNRRSGLLAITLPSMANKTKELPPRFEDNWDKEGDGNKYAKWKKYPSSPEALAGWIEDAFLARDSRAQLVDNSRQLFGYNRNCE